MKRNDWKIILATILYVVLFYLQTPGINFLILTVFLVATLFIQNTDNLKKPAWLTLALGSLISGFMVFKLGTSLPVITNILSLIVLAGITFKPNSSFIIAAFHGLFSIAGSIPTLVLRVANRKNKSLGGQVLVKTALLILPLLVVAVFFFLYRASNPLFYDLTKNFNLEWISLPLVRFTIIGFLLFYGVYVQQVVQRIFNKDQDLSDTSMASTLEEHQAGFFGGRLQLKNEVFIGVALFLMLNLLIAVVNFLDLTQLWPNPVLPENEESFSGFLHQSVTTLISSIVLAVIIVLFFFRGFLSHAKEGVFLKVLAVVWVVQNIWLVASTALRSSMYIEAYGLSHKRIGVFVYLTLCIIGLIITLIKVLAKRNNAFLIRKNSWAFYAFMVLATFVNWDMVITNYNIDNAERIKKIAIDNDYLLGLSHTNTAKLIEHNPLVDNFELYEADYAYSPSQKLSEKIYTALRYRHENKWPSLCLEKNTNYDAVKNLHFQGGAISVLNLNGANIDDVEVIIPLENLKSLNISENYLGNDYSSLSKLPALNYLNLSYNGINQPFFGDTPPPLTHLSLKGNSIEEYGFLDQFPGLEELVLASNNAYKPKTLSFFPKLKTIDISGNSWYDWSFLSKNPQLEKLICNNLHTLNQVHTVPAIDSLETIEFIGSNLSNYSLLQELDKSKNIKFITLYNNRFTSFGSFRINNKLFFKNAREINMSNNLLSEFTALPNWSKLSKLNLSHNSIEQLSGLDQMKGLTSLQLDHNPLVKIQSSATFNQLSTINLSNTSISDCSELPNAPNLEVLNLNYCRITSVNCLETYKELRDLDIASTNVSSVAVLSALPKLEVLNLTNLELLNINELAEFKHLKHLYLGSITAATFEKVSTLLPDTEIYHSISDEHTSIDYTNNITY